MPHPRKETDIVFYHITPQVIEHISANRLCNKCDLFEDLLIERRRVEGESDEMILRYRCNDCGHGMVIKDGLPAVGKAVIDTRTLQQVRADENKDENKSAGVQGGGGKMGARETVASASGGMCRVDGSDKSLPT